MKKVPSNRKNGKLAKLMPHPGAGRWWKVELMRNAARTPIKVTLMEEVVDGRRAISSALMYKRTVATPEEVSETARKLLEEVGAYESLIGECPRLDASGAYIDENHPGED